MAHSRSGIRNLDHLGPKKKPAEQPLPCLHKKRGKFVVRQERTGARLNIVCLSCKEVLGFEWTENWAEIQKLLTEDSQNDLVDATIRQGGNR